MSVSKIRVAVLFGGKSAEHEVSLQSARNVINALDTDKYEIVPSTMAGSRLLLHASIRCIPDGPAE